LTSDEFPGDLPETPADAADRVASALAALTPASSSEERAAAIAAAIDKPASDAVVSDLVDTVEEPFEEIYKRQQAIARALGLAQGAGLAVPEGARGQRFTAAIANALMDLDSPEVLLPSAPGAVAAAEGGDPAAITIQATGLPVLHRGLSTSVS